MTLYDGTQVPTLEELIATGMVCCWKGTSNQPIDVVPWGYFETLLIAPINLTILSVALSFEYWTLAASDSAYWTATLEAGSATAGFTVAAVRSTQNTGANANGGITARAPWTFDAAVTPTTPIAVTAGQLLGITWAPTGSPAAQVLPMTYTIRYAAA